MLCSLLLRKGMNKMDAPLKTLQSHKAHTKFHHHHDTSYTQDSIDTEHKSPMHRPLRTDTIRTVVVKSKPKKSGTCLTLLLEKRNM